jgi:eukaryotic-like serine/threonine-protein kinase
MPLSTGDKLGPYEILAPIGAGGMGEVWKARDTRLDRIVAIKTSKTEFSERFEGEARAVAALNHPSICQLYDEGTLPEGGTYLVMEFIDGWPIAPVDSPRKLLDLVVQIADGMAAAHAAGFTHRDLKPGNILVTGPQTPHPGRVKILDFGLAKLSGRPLPPSETTQTMAAITNPGSVVGTVSYMSPEQARGAEVDACSDQFSFGLILCELAAGKRAFVRPSTAETMAAIIRDEAEPLPPSVPAPVRWVVERCLAKDPAERYDSTRDLYRELKQIRDRLSETTSASTAWPSGAVSTRAGLEARRRMLLQIGLALSLGAGLAALLIRPAPADYSRYKLTCIASDALTKWSSAWSPDGKSIAYTALIGDTGQVFTKTLGAPDAVQLTHASDFCDQPFWSPDGATIYYSSLGDLWAIAASGGTPELVMEKAAAPALHPDGRTLVFERDGDTWVGSLKGGAPRRLEQAPRGVLTMRLIKPRAFSPDGSRFVVGVGGQLWIVPFPSGTARNLGSTGYSGTSWFPDNRHLLIDGENQRFLAILDTADGSRRVIYSGTEMALGPSVSPDGKRIAFSSGRVEWDVVEISLQDGRVHTVVGGGVGMQPEWAPSGTHFLVSRVVNDGQGRVIEDRSATEGFSRRVVDEPLGASGDAALPRWAPDGTRFLFVQNTAGRKQLAVSYASGGAFTPLAELNSADAHAWSPDGQWFAFTRVEGGKQRLVKMRSVMNATPMVLANAAPAVTGHEMIQWSPAGDWIAYPSANGIDMISPDGSTARKLTARKLWAFAFSKDGAQLYGILRNTAGEGGQWRLYVIDVKSGADKMLASLDLPASANAIAGFSLHPDGKRFLTSIAKWPFDIWMFEGFDQPKQTAWLDRLLRR